MIKNILGFCGAVALLLSVCACSQKAQANAEPINSQDMTTQTPDTASARVLVETTAGNFTILLYGDTPKHRDNFLKLVNEKYLEGTLFHRVIKNFMIQAGDPDSKNAQPGQRLGAGGPDYKLDAEIVFPTHFHKRGALAAARQGDQVNPLKKSSGSQFYIVTGKKLSEAEMSRLDMQIKNNQMQEIFNRLVQKNRQEIIDLQQRGDRDALKALQDSLVAQTEAEAAKNPGATVTDEMKQAYTTVGGAPHLDGQYTVFGEIIDGMDVVDKIEKAETDGADRPTQDIRILSMKVIK